MARQIVFGLVVLHLLAAAFLYYPALRLGQWLTLDGVVAQGIALTLFFSQVVVRVLLRHAKSGLVRGLRIGADFFLGIAPVMLLTVLIGEMILSTTSIAALDLALAILCIWLAAGVWGTYKALRPDLVEVALQSHKLSESVRFVQISDVHIGSRSSRFLSQVVSRVNRLEPDFLCITGDFIDQRGIDEQQLAPLAELSMPVYFCTGNHEHYEDLEEIVERLKKFGVEVLRGRVIERHGIQIIGYDDHSNPDFLRDALPLLGLNREIFSLLLYHRPQGLEHAAAHGVDLKISGHTHNGQILPFNLLVRAQFKYLKGLHQHGQSHLYVNEGTGTWGPVMRLGTRSEITVFEISSGQPHNQVKEGEKT